MHDGRTLASPAEIRATNIKRHVVWLALDDLLSELDEKHRERAQKGIDLLQEQLGCPRNGRPTDAEAMPCDDCLVDEGMARYAT